MNHIPTWVFTLFLVLLYLGIKRCRTRTVSIERLAIIPAIFIFMSLRGVFHLFGSSPVIYFMIVLGAVCGGCLGCIYVKNRVIKADKQNRLVQIPGDISMLILIMMIFFVEYFIHYSVAAHFSMVNTLWFESLAVFISGLVVGISVGRNLMYFYKYIHASSVNLSDQVA